jgi:hypothetical protein
VCARSELVSLTKAGIVAIDLAYAPRTSLVAGSHEGERAQFVFRDGAGATRVGSVIDVYLATL